MPFNKTRVTVLTSSFPRFEGDFAGHFIRKYLHSLAGSGLDINVIAPHHPRVSIDSSWTGLRVKHFRYFFPSSLESFAYEGGLLNSIKKPLGIIQAPFFLAAFFVSALRAAKRTDIFHAHWLLSALVAISVKYVTGTAVVLTLWGSDIILLKLPLIGYFLRWIVNRADAIICENQQFKRYLESCGISNRKISVIGNGHDFESFIPADKEIARAKLSLPTHKFTLLSAGRLVPVKGHSDLIKALPAIVQHDKNIQLVILGDGEHELDLKYLASSLGVAQYTLFTGLINNQAMPLWLNSADIFVLPSLSEGSPNIIKEAMSCDLPIVATCVGGIPEMIRDGIDGVLVPPNNPQLLANAIIRLRQDSNLRKNLANSACKTAHESSRTWSAQATEISRVYTAIMSASEKPRPLKVLTVYYKHKPGGLCKRLQMSIEAYLENGHEVHYVAVTPYPYTHESLVAHILPSPFKNHDHLWFWIYFFLTAPFYTLFVGIKENIRFISSLSPLYACIGALTQWLLNVPQLTFIFSKPKFTTGCHAQYRFMDRLEHFMEYSGLTLSKQLLANSNGSRTAWIQEYGRAAKRIEVFPNNVDDPPFNRSLQKDRLCAEFGIESRRFVLATSGILEPHKNIEFLIGAFSSIKNTDAVLMIIGAGEQMNHLKQYVLKCSVNDRVIFTSWRTDVQSLLQGVDLYVFPSLREGMSDALLEAMICKIPCLVSNIPENMEVVSNPQQHFSPYNAQDLADKIKRCIVDREFYETILESTRQDVNRFIFNWKEKLINKSGLSRIG